MSNRGAEDSPNSALIERVKKRDVAALADYLLAIRPQLLTFIERQLGAQLRQKLEVDDIVQEVSVEAVRALPQAEFEHRDPFSWLCQIAERRIIDAHRKHFGAQRRDGNREIPLGPPGESTERPGLIDMLAASMTSPTAAFSRKGREMRLLAALAELPAEQREALRLRYVEGLASKDVADRLGKSHGSVRVMLSRAIDRLQQILGPEDETH